jgi:hypothetical protein
MQTSPSALHIAIVPLHIPMFFCIKKEYHEKTFTNRTHTRHDIPVGQLSVSGISLHLRQYHVPLGRR